MQRTQESKTRCGDVFVEISLVLQVLEEKSLRLEEQPGAASDLWLTCLICRVVV